MLISKNLFDLIKSLSGSEKRYIKINLQKEKDKSGKLYLALFNQYIHFTEKHDNFDTKNQKLVLSELGTLPKINYLKHQLYQKIIASLQNFSTAKSASIIYDIETAKIIFNKGLYSICRALINKIKEKCIKYQQCIYYVDIIELENKLDGITATTAKKMNAKVLYKSAIANIHRNNKYSQARSELNNIIKQDNTLKDTFLKKQFIKTYNDCKASFSKTEFSFVSNYYYFEINSLYYSGLKDYQQLLLNSKKHFRYFQKNTNLVHELIPVGFISVFQKYTEALLHFKKHKHVEQLITRIKESKIILTKNNSPVINNHLQGLVLRTEMILMLRRKKFEGIEDIFNRVIVFHNTFSNYKAESTSISLLFILARILFANKNFELTLTIIEKIIAEKDKSKRTDIRAATLLLKLITYFELGNDYEINATKKQLVLFLEDKKWLGEKEKILIKNLTQKINLSDKKQQLVLFKELKAKLYLDKSIAFFPFEDYLNINDWVENKIDQLLLQI